jgi:4-amino-4-deoxy-L-arabinose transferase-like glycosyltransferase
MNKAALALICVVAVAGLGLAFQGWRTRGPDVDVIASMVRTVALVERGHIPQRGNLTDLNSFRPPGLSWLLAPGVLLFSDPRHAELPATALLYVATLIGVFALGRQAFGPTVAAWATVMYGFSSIAINFAAVMQPKAYPVFTVWMAYCVVMWVSRRDARWLGASLVVWAAGLYVHIEMLPFALAYPVICWRHQPPIRLRPLVVAVVLALVMWSPYLVFQQQRDFMDLRSQVLSQPLDPRATIVNAYCGEEPAEATVMPMQAKLGDWRDRPEALAGLILMNFETRVPLGPWILLALTVGGAMLAFRSGEDAAVLATTAIVPGAVLILLGEPGVPRTIGIWPFELLLITFCAVHLAQRIARSKAIIAVAMVALTAVVAINLQVLSRVRDWPVNGWSGVEPAQVEWRDYRSVRCSDER